MPHNTKQQKKESLHKQQRKFQKDIYQFKEEDFMVSGCLDLHLLLW